MSRCTRCITSSVITPSLRSADHRLALGLEQLAAQPLVLLRALLDAVVVHALVARAEAVGAEAVLAARALGRVLAHPAFRRELLEARERSLGRLDARLRVLALGAAVVLESQQADQPRERQALADERDEDDRERQEHDQVALREVRRQRERGGERDRAADPGPRDHRRRLPRRVRIVLADACGRAGAARR